MTRHEAISAVSKSVWQIPKKGAETDTA